MPIKTQLVNPALGKGPAACNVLVSLAVTQLDCFSKLSHLAGVASQTQKARLDKLREWPSSSDTASSSTPDKATAYLLVLSLLVWSPTQWTVSRQSVLLYLLRFAFSQHWCWLCQQLERAVRRRNLEMCIPRDQILWAGAVHVPAAEGRQ